MDDNMHEAQTTLLLIDDNTDTRSATAAVLERAGYAVLQGATARDALTMTHAYHPALVLLDVELPDGNGLVIARQLKADPDLVGVFVILLSGSKISPEDQSKGLMEGLADGYIVHPVSPKVLVGWVGAFLRLRATQETLRESEERYRSILNASPDDITITDLECRMLMVSPAAVKMFGCVREEELLGKFVQDFIVPDDRPRVSATITLMFKDVKIGPGEYRGIHTDGSIFNIEINTQFIRNTEGQPVKIVFVIRDITESKVADEALRASEAKYHLLIENLNEGIWHIDKDARTTFVNPCMARMLGYTVDEMAGKHLFDFMDEQGVELAKYNLERRQQGIMEQHDFEFIRKDGRRMFTLIATAPIVDADGRYLGSIAGVQDITDRKRAEDSLRESELRFRILIEQASVAIGISRNGTGIFVNRRLAQMFGLPNVEAAVGRLSIEYFAPHVRDEVGEIMRAHREDSRVPLEFESIGMRDDGSQFPIQVAGSFVQLPDGPARIIFVTDITKRRRAEENLRQLEIRLRRSEKMEAVGQLAGGIAHDFNNVLGGIIGYTDMSLGFAERGSILEKNLNKVLTAADRAKHLVQQILTFSRQGNPQKSIVAVRPIIKEVLGLLRASIPSSVLIEADLRKDVKPVFAEPTKLHEAILNLATNAVHAMNRKGTLTVRLYPLGLGSALRCHSGELAPGDYVVIEMSDTGCGMDAATLSRAFEPFYTTKAVGEGTGLGLSVVLGIVQSHEGDLQVETVPGEGTTFRILLPVSVEPVAGNADVQARLEISGDEHVLFVDDEQTLVEMVEGMLVPLGYTVTGMSNSLEALDFMKAHGTEIDILVTDLTMPGMNGIDLAREVRALRPGLPIILCTGFSSELNPESAAAAGIGRLMMKPYRTHEIGKAVRDALDVAGKGLSA